MATSDTKLSKQERLWLRLGELKRERESFRAHWMELADYLSPRRGRFFVKDRNKGDRRSTKILNAYGTKALDICRAGLLSGIMSPARPWFSLQTPDPELMEFQPVKVWLEKVELILRAVFNSGNLYNMAPTLLQETAQFGTGCMLDLDDHDDVSRYYTQTIGSYMLAQNDLFKIDTVYREFEMTTLQMIRAYGYENVCDAVKTAYDRSNYEMWWPVYHAIEPNDAYDPSSKLNRNFAWRECYFEPRALETDKAKYKFLKEGGFREFPAYCPRWEVTGEDIYATNCPGMVALPDIKALQSQEREKGKGIAKQVSPPLHGPASLANQPVSSLPGGLTLYDGADGANGLRSIYDVKIDVAALMTDIQKTERRIESAFMADMFLAITNMEGIQPRNEFELNQRNQERLLQIGPALEQFHGEFLDRLIDRTFNKLARAKVLPPPPPELQNKELKIEYVSTLALAQRAAATRGIDQVAAFAGGLMKAGFVSVQDTFNADQALQDYSRVLGAPAKIVRPDDEVNKIRADREKVQQQAQQVAMMNEGASAAKQGAEAMATAATLPQAQGS